MKLAVALTLAVALAGCNAADRPQAQAAGSSAAPVAISVPAGAYRLDPTHASLIWSVRHLGLSNYTARFTGLDATVNLNPGDITASSIKLSVDPRSVRADYPADYKATHANSPYASWDEDLAMSKGFLNAGAFPSITFQSTAVRPTGANTADVTGDLTLLGVTQPVTMKVTFNGQLASHPLSQTPAVGFTAEGAFKRSQFGMSAGGPIGDEVSLRFNGEFLKERAGSADTTGR